MSTEALNPETTSPNTSHMKSPLHPCPGGNPSTWRQVPNVRAQRPKKDEGKSKQPCKKACMSPRKEMRRLLSTPLTSLPWQQGASHLPVPRRPKSNASSHCPIPVSVLKGVGTVKPGGQNFYHIPDGTQRLGNSKDLRSTHIFLLSFETGLKA